MRQRYPAAERKLKLLEAARRVIKDRGYGGLTTAAIAKAARISEPILYRHFSSKRVLIAQLLNQVMRSVIEKLRGIALSHKTTLGAIQAVCRAYPDLAREHEADFQFINQMLVGRNDPEIQMLLIQHFDSYVSLLESLVARGQAEKVLRHDIGSEEGAWHLVHAALGYLITRSLRPRRPGIKESEQRWADVAVDGLRMMPSHGKIS